MQEVQLLEMLQTEIGLLEKLNELSLLKKEALLNDDFSRLETIVFQEETSFRQLKTIDDACASQVQFFLQANPLNAEVTETFQNKHLELRQLATRLQVNNQFNMDLTKDSLAITQFMLNALTAPGGQKILTYNATGKMVDKKTKNHLLDYKG
jgi:flagellar biosynthesis/type III secretory pathway chaperone